MNEMILRKPVSRIFREINVVITILSRDITLFFKSPGMLIFSLAMPIVMMGMLGGSLSQSMAGGLGSSFGAIIGMIGTADYANAVLFNPMISLLVIASLTIVFLIVGTFFFARSEKNR